MIDFERWVGCSFSSFGLELGTELVTFQICWILSLGIFIPSSPWTAMTGSFGLLLESES